MHVATATLLLKLQESIIDTVTNHNLNNVSYVFSVSVVKITTKFYEAEPHLNHDRNCYVRCNLQ